MDYTSLNDYELISYIQENNEDANNLIIKKYEPLINSIATKMISHCPYLGLEKSDLIQEGMIGLNHAIGYFNEQKDITFYTYAKTCIERRLISVVVSANRLKHKNLNESISFDTADEGTIEFFLKDETTNPETIVVNKEEKNDIINKVNNRLTDLEKQVFELMLSYFNYKEIAKILEKEPKQIDNAIQRIKIKVKEILKNQN